MSNSRRYPWLSLSLVMLLIVADRGLAQSSAVGSGVAKRRSTSGAAITGERSRSTTSTASARSRTQVASATGQKRSNGSLASRLGTMHQQTSHAEVIESPAEYYESEGEYVDGGCADGSCGAGECDSCHGTGCEECGDYGNEDVDIQGNLQYLLSRTEVFSGMQSFSGPANRGGSGSFGYHEGFNLATPFLNNHWGLGVQAGAMFTQSNFNGAGYTRDDRSQIFATLGFFRRVDWGLQGGIAVDYLRDDWYYQTDLNQIRAEISWKMPAGNELGFMLSDGLGDDRAISRVNVNNIPTNLTEDWQITSLYAFFLRRQFANGASARLFAGFSGQSDGYFGADAELPLDSNWALRGNVAYLLPEQGNLNGGNVEESWNMAITIVWAPGAFNKCGCDYYRPLFNVANNGNFMVDRQTR